MTDAKGNQLINWIVTIGDILLINAILFSLTYIYPNETPQGICQHFSMVLFLVSIITLLVALIFPPVIHHRRLVVKSTVKRNFVTTLSITALVYFTIKFIPENANALKFCVRFALFSYFITIIVRITERLLLNWIRTRGHNSRSVVFIGSDPANLEMYYQMLSEPDTGYRVLGYYSDDTIENAPDDFTKLGSRDDFREILDNKKGLPSHIDELYCSLSHSESTEIRRIIEFCDKNVMRFYYVPRIFSNLQLSLHPEISGNIVLFTNHTDRLSSLSNRMLKRSFDIVVSLLALICLLPFFPLVVLMIKIQSPKGPIFFRQERTGLNGENFVCWKFRSMHVNADADKIQATKDDPRKFPFGNFMRKANIDEFPQFWNVLKGDMSVVGPRPHMLLHTEKYSALIDKYMVRHFSKPGITGYAQVTGFRGETEELWQMEGRIQKDIWYIENWSLWLDIKIVFLTAWSIVHHDKNAY